MRAANALELFVVADFGGGPVGAAQMVEQVRRGDEQDDVALRQTFVADGGREVGLATAKGAAQDEPARRLFGKVARAVAGEYERFVFAGADLGARHLEVVEAFVGEGFQVAESPQPGLTFLVAGRAEVWATEEFAEVRVVVGHVVAEHAQAVAERQLAHNARNAPLQLSMNSA